MTKQKLRSFIQDLKDELKEIQMNIDTLWWRLDDAMNETAFDGDVSW